MEINFDVFDKKCSGVYMIKKDKNGNIINTYHSATEAADALLKHELMNKNRKIVSCAISMCARGISKTAYKYVWEYEN